MKNPFVRNIFQVLNVKTMNYLKKCPLTGIVSLVNLAFPKSFLEIMPHGKYVIKVRLYYEQVKSKQLRLDIQVTFTVLDD